MAQLPEAGFRWIFSPLYSFNPQKPATLYPRSLNRAAARAALPPPFQAVRMVLSFGISPSLDSSSSMGMLT